MTVNELISRIAILPPDATIASNSGWECGPPDIGGIWYNCQLNEVHITQGGSYEKERGYKKGFWCIYNWIDEEEI